MNNQQQPDEIWVAFAGLVDGQIARSAVSIFTEAAKDKVCTIHLLIQSTGGIVNDGIFLHNFIKFFPIDIVTYNCGFVASAAAVAYLGAKKRAVSAQGAFMLHRATGAMVGGLNARQTQSLTNSLNLDDNRIEQILKGSLNMTAEQWQIHDRSDLFLSADEAVKCDLATEVSDFVPKGPLFYI